jgi:hypothetical protein
LKEWVDSFVKGSCFIYAICIYLTLYTFSFEITGSRLSDTRCLIQDVVSPHCGDKRMVRRCTRRKWSPWSLMNTTGCFSLFKFYYVRSDIHRLLYIANCYTCIKHTIAYPCITQKTTDLATRIPLKTGGKLRCLGRDSSFWSTCDTLYAAVKPNYFDMTSYHWNVRQNTVTWRWWMNGKNNVTSHTKCSLPQSIVHILIQHFLFA